MRSIVYNKTQWLLLFMVTLTVIKAQQPYNYDTPLDKKLYTYTFQSSNIPPLKASEWGVKLNDYDGITITATVELNLDISSVLYTFYHTANTGDKRKFLEVYYRKNTLLFRRYYDEGQFYDYELFDPLFKKPELPAISKYYIKFYFTSSFMWVQTRNTTNWRTDGYLSPIFFGINTLDNHNMDQFLNRKGGFIIAGNTDGSFNPNAIFSNDINVYTFKYTELKNDIQNNFSNKPDRIIPSKEN